MDSHKWFTISSVLLSVWPSSSLRKYCLNLLQVHIGKDISGYRTHMPLSDWDDGRDLSLWCHSERTSWTAQNLAQCACKRELWVKMESVKIVSSSISGYLSVPNLLGNAFCTYRSSCTIININYLKTRKHSSRMRTTRLQTVHVSEATTICHSGMGGVLMWTSLNRSDV